MLVGLTGSQLNNPIAGGGVTLIDCDSLDLRTLDKQRKPIQYPVEAVITIDSPSNAPARGLRLIWGARGAAQELIVGNGFGPATPSTLGAQGRFVFPSSINIPVKGDYFRLDISSTLAAGEQLIKGSIAEGRCPPLLLKAVMDGAPAPAATATLTNLPNFLRRFRITRLPSTTSFTISDTGGTFEINVPSGAEMDWAPIDRESVVAGGLLLTNTSPVDQIIQANAWFELSL